MPRGRITKLDDLTSKRICDALRDGCSRSAASEAAGVSRQSLADWLARGRDEEPLFAEFLVRVKEAEAIAEKVITDALFTSAKGGSVPAQVAWLERRRPADWAKREMTANDLTAVAGTSTDADADVSQVESVLAALKSRKTG